MKTLGWITIATLCLAGCNSQKDERSKEMDELAKSMAAAHEITQWEKFECEILETDAEGITYQVSGIPYINDDFIMFKIYNDGQVEHFPVP